MAEAVNGKMNISFQTNTSISREENVVEYMLFLKTTAYCLLLLVSVLGNIFIIRSVCKDERLKTTTNFLVANMAISDLMSTCFLVPLRISRMHFGTEWFIEGKFGEALCKLAVFCPDTSIAVSFYSCLFIAIDRYFAVTNPLRGGFRKSRLKFMIPGIWIFSVLILSPYLYYYQLISIENTNFCFYKDRTFMRVHLYVLVALNFGVPLPIITTLYAMIVLTLRRHKAPGNQRYSVRRKRQQQNSKVLKMSITIVSLLSLSWGYSILIILLAWEGFTIESRNVREIVYFSALFIADITHTYNFFIYLVFNNVYRENFKAVVGKCFCNNIFGGVVRADIAGTDNAVYNANGEEDHIHTLSMTTLSTNS